MNHTLGINILEMKFQKLINFQNYSNKKNSQHLLTPFLG